MPRKSKKKAEVPAVVETPAAGLHEPDEPELKASAETGKETGKKVRARAKKVSPPTDEARAEAMAEAADTFEQAFEDRVPVEHPALPAIEPIASETEALIPDPDTEELEHADETATHEDERPPARLERLQKILSQAGVASRRHAEEMIVEGRVQVNGQVVTALGSKADPDRDHIRVDGKLLRGAERLRYFVLNKPKGYVTTVSDPEGRPTVMQFFQKMHERLYPVGRLDYQSEGLLLVTNDGELANKLTKPASGVERTYLVKVSGQPAADALDQLRAGLAIDRGRRGEGRVQTAPAEIREVRQGDNPWFEVVLREGRNRELRKMFEEIGHHVEKIRRVEYGPLVLDLEPGQFRELEPEEVARLRLAADGKWRKPKAKEREVRRKEFKGRRPEERSRPAQRKPAPEGREWRRDSRGAEGRDQGAGNREQRRTAPSMRPPRPGQGDGRRRPDRAFGQRQERETREETGRGTRPGFPDRQGQPDRPAFERGRAGAQGFKRGPGRPTGPRPEGRKFEPGRAGAQGFKKGPGRPAGPRPDGRKFEPGRAGAQGFKKGPGRPTGPRPDGRKFEPGRAGAQGFKKGPGRPTGPRPEGRRFEGGRSGKPGPAMGRGRPASGGGTRAPQGPSSRRSSSRPTPNRGRDHRGKRG